jgi:hypothetical protein
MQDIAIFQLIVMIFYWPNIKEALATILTQKIICFGNW